MKFISIVVLFLSSIAFCQTATVVALSPEDAAEAKRINQEKLDAAKHWNDFQEKIKNKYLIVDKTDPAASSSEWYPASDRLTGVTTWSLISGSVITMGSDGSAHSSDECDPKVIAERKKFELERKKFEDEREAHARRYRKGWEDNQEFIFTGDWMYIVPKPIDPPVRFQGPTYFATPVSGSGTGNGILLGNVR